MKAQTIFNKVARHLLKQGERAIDTNGRCVYRRVGGLRCAAGAAIPNRLYDLGMEGTGPIRNVFRRYPAIEEYLGRENLGLIRDLQITHDTGMPGYWRAELADVAKKHGLSGDVLKEAA